MVILIRLSLIISLMFLLLFIILDLALFAQKQLLINSECLKMLNSLFISVG